MDQELLDHVNAERILEEGWRLFQQKGYANVAVLRGGMMAWEAANLLEATT